MKRVARNCINGLPCPNVTPDVSHEELLQAIRGGVRDAILLIMEDRPISLLQAVEDGVRDAMQGMKLDRA
jgi:hypothetical protein